MDAFSKLHPVGGIGNPCIVAKASVFLRATTLNGSPVSIFQLMEASRLCSRNLSVGVPCAVSSRVDTICVHVTLSSINLGSRAKMYALCPQTPIPATPALLLLGCGGLIPDFGVILKSCSPHSISIGCGSPSSLPRPRSG